jgi:hypothetical protein
MPTAWWWHPCWSTVRFELIGPPTDQGLRQWLQDDYDRIIPPAPW